MWKSQVPKSRAAKKPIVQPEADDWETDPDFVNDVSEKEQRYGSKTVEGSGYAASRDMGSLRQEVIEVDATTKKDEYKKNAPSYGYGGTFGVERDRMDKSAVGTEYKGKTEKHSSVKDNAVGYGGSYGVQKDRQDQSALGWGHHENVEKHSSQKDAAMGYGGTYGVLHDRQDSSALGWDHKEQVEKHSSQKDGAQGYGGNYGVQTDRQDKSALGWDHREQTEKHSSQKDVAHGYGGTYGVQADRKDRSALGWDHKEQTEKHSSQKDAAHGYGGSYGVESDRIDKSAVGWDHNEQTEKHSSQKDYSRGFGGKYGVETDRKDASAVGWERENGTTVPSKQPVSLVDNGEERSATASSLKARFENMAKAQSQAAPSRPAPGRLNKTWQKPQLEEPTKQVEPDVRNEIHETQPVDEPIYSNGSHAEVANSGESTSHEEPVNTFDSSPYQEPIEINESARYEESAPPVSNDIEQLSEQLSSQASVNDEWNEPIRAEATAFTSQADQNEVYSGANAAGDSLYQNVPMEPEAPPAADMGVTATAQFDFDPTADDELQLITGAMITNIQMVDEGWWYGTSNGASGLFPANYVELNQ